MAELVQYKRKTDWKDEIILDVEEANNGKETDPICGMLVDPQTADSFSEFEDVIYYFCCGGCKEKFEAEPAAYI